MTNQTPDAAPRGPAGGRASEEEMVVSFLPLIRRMASLIMRRLPPNVRIDDLEAAGVVGLLQAVQHFDPLKGDQFDAYARRKIECAMLDELRRADVVPKDVRQRSRRLVEAMAAVQRRDGTIEDEAVARELGLDMAAYHALLERTADVRLLSLDQPGPGGPGSERGVPLALQVPGDQPTALQAMLDAESTVRVAAALRRLPQRFRQVLALYYLEEMNMKQIAQIIGVTPARVCQLHSEAVHAVRALLEEEET